MVQQCRKRAFFCFPPLKLSCAVRVIFCILCTWRSTPRSFAVIDSVVPFTFESDLRLIWKLTWARLQGRNEVRWRPGQEASLAPPCLKLRSSGSKFTVLKKVLVTLLGLFGAPIVTWRPGNCASLPPLVMPLRGWSYWRAALFLSGFIWIISSNV